MSWHEVEEQALQNLRDGYEREIICIAEELRPRLETREFRGMRAADWRQAVREGFTPPLWRLEAELRGRLVRTLEDAQVVLLCSESADDVAARGDTLDMLAGAVAAWDVLRVAFVRGWWYPEPGEDPGLPELAPTHAAAAIERARRAA